MENAVTWLTTNIPLVIGGLYILFSAAGQTTGMFNGPKADKAKNIFDVILLWLRRFGGGTFKDEPGTNSIPLLSGDSGERTT